MNRRGFLKVLGGGLVASATMAEAGMLAEFMDWLKRKPAWSFPPKRAMTHDDVVEFVAGKMQAAYEELDKQLLADMFFRDTPFQSYLRTGKVYSEAPWNNAIVTNIRTPTHIPPFHLYSVPKWDDRDEC